MNDQQILALYTQAYNRARQTGGGGRETPHQIAHVAGLKAILAIGGGAEGVISAEEAPLRLQPEDPARAHQRRLNFASHWLSESGRRERIAAMPSFTHVTDAFAAGGLYERAYLAGESRAEELAGHMLKVEENAIHEELSAALGMQALLEDLFEITGAETPESLVDIVSTLVQQGGAGATTPALPPIINQPFEAELEAGNYAWCSCGRSKKQPFCDGSHKGTGDEPVQIRLKKPTKVKLCRCKQTSTPPYCDGTHETLVAPVEPEAPADEATA